VLRAGTHIPLTLVNALNTKQSHEGDGVYLETAFPIFVDGRLVIPRNSYVQGTVTKATPPGHVKGKAELYIRFDSLTLPNGVARDFRSRLDSADAAQGQVDRSEGTITGENRTGNQAGTVVRDTGMGASVGSLGGMAAGHMGMGVGLGAAAGGIAGLASAIGKGGKGVVLPRGTTMEMVLDRDLLYTPEELRF
jgi:type IV secretion system protein VirB10